MGLMDIFAGFRGQPSGAVTPVTQQPVTAVATDPSKGNPLVPGNATPQSTGSLTAIPAAATGDASPLEGFKDLWLNDPNAKKPASLEVSIPVDQVKIMEAARKYDFTKAISPETMVKLSKGDPAAIADAINQAAQAAFAQASGSTARIVEGALNRQAEVFNNEVLPAALKKHAVASSLRTESPIFNDPAVTPLLSMVEAQLQNKYPQASAQEITTKAREYLLATSGAIMGTSDTQMVVDKPTAGAKNPLSRKDQDWGVFFDQPAA